MDRYNRGELTAEQSAVHAGPAGRARAVRTGPVARANSWPRSSARPSNAPPRYGLVQEHLENGDLCAVVTATNTSSPPRSARAFGVPHLIAT